MREEKVRGCGSAVSVGTGDLCSSQTCYFVPVLSQLPKIT